MAAGDAAARRSFRNCDRAWKAVERALLSTAWSSVLDAALTELLSKPAAVAILLITPRQPDSRLRTY